MKVWITRITHFALLILILFVLFKRLPELNSHIKNEGQPVPDFQFETLSGKFLKSSEVKQPLILIFWATWCSPCEIELKRINQMILDQKLSAESVWALSIQEEKPIVTQIASDRHYQFQVGLDPYGRISDLFQVKSTPTVIFIEKNKTIQWMTSGISPSLELRIHHFIN